MQTLKGDTIYLRALEVEDLEFLYVVENDENIWHVSNTQTPYSKFLIRQYLQNAHQDIYEAKQLRLAICENETDETIGLIDLFDFDPKNHRAGIGILIHDTNHRGKGFGQQALELLLDYSFIQLQIHVLYANIGTQNENSLHLFATFGFEKVGIRKDWNYIGNQYEDEAIFQLINPNQIK
jgi:diamine N-acetyltransferase